MDKITEHVFCRFTMPLRDSTAIKVVAKYCCRGSASIQTAVTLDPIRMQQMPD